MPRENGTAVRADAAVDELDDLLGALADWRRRLVVAHLSREGGADVDALAERIAANDDRLTPAEAEVALVHDQLPRLDEAGVVRYDAGDRRCELRSTPRAAALVRVLHAVRDEG